MAPAASKLVIDLCDSDDEDTLKDTRITAPNVRSELATTHDTQTARSDAQSQHQRSSTRSGVIERTQGSTSHLSSLIPSKRTNESDGDQQPADRKSLDAERRARQLSRQHALPPLPPLPPLQLLQPLPALTLPNLSPQLRLPQRAWTPPEVGPLPPQRRPPALPSSYIPAPSAFRQVATLQGPTPEQQSLIMALSTPVAMPNFSWPKTPYARDLKAACDDVMAQVETGRSQIESLVFCGELSAAMYVILVIGAMDSTSKIRLAGLTLPVSAHRRHGVDSLLAITVRRQFYLAGFGRIWPIILSDRDEQLLVERPAELVALVRREYGLQFDPPRSRILVMIDHDHQTVKVTDGHDDLESAKNRPAATKTLFRLLNALVRRGLTKQNLTRQPDVVLLVGAAVWRNELQERYFLQGVDLKMAAGTAERSLHQFSFSLYQLPRLSTEIDSRAELVILNERIVPVAGCMKAWYYTGQGSDGADSIQALRKAITGAKGVQEVGAKIANARQQYARANAPLVR